MACFCLSSLCDNNLVGLLVQTHIHKGTLPAGPERTWQPTGKGQAPRSGTLGASGSSPGGKQCSQESPNGQNNSSETIMMSSEKHCYQGPNTKVVFESLLYFSWASEVKNMATLKATLYWFTLLFIYIYTSQDSQAWNVKLHVYIWWK